MIIICRANLSHITWKCNVNIKRKACSSIKSWLLFLVKQTLKCHFTCLQPFYRSQHSANWVCFTGGAVAPSGHLSLIDEAHMWAPYVSWQGQRGAVTSEPSGL